MFKKSLYLLAVLAVGLGFTFPVQAGLIQISAITADYLSNTTRIAISDAVKDYTEVSSLADENLTVSFLNKPTLRTVGVGWNTWSSTPYAESATPRVLYEDSKALTLYFSQPLDTFGVEAEPNPYSLQSFTITFFNDDPANPVESFSQDIHGFAGSRLLAATVDNSSDDYDGSVFTGVAISSTSDFAIGQLRYRLASDTITETTSGSPHETTLETVTEFAPVIDIITAIPVALSDEGVITIPADIFDGTVIAIIPAADIVITAIQEPGSWTLFGAGLVGLGFMRLRKA